MTSLNGSIWILAGLAMWAQVFALRRASELAPEDAEKLGINLGEWPNMILSISIFEGAVGFLALMLGWGTIRRQSWVWRPALAGAFLWLVLGALGTLRFFQEMPILMQELAREGVPADNIETFRSAGLAAVFFRGLLIPGCLVWFYSGVKVAELSRVEAARLQTPAPLWILVGSLAMIAAGLVSALACGGAIPLFGVLISGPLGWLVLFGSAYLSLQAGLRVVQQQLMGWHLSLLLVGGLAISMGFSQQVLDPAAVNRAMGWPSPEGWGQLRENPYFSGWTSGMLVMLLAFIFYLRRYFPGYEPMDAGAEE
ncbi:MAG: hypothetical protein ACFCU3_06245 [Verrucomicrobiales bacterium]